LQDEKCGGELTWDGDRFAAQIGHGAGRTAIISGPYFSPTLPPQLVSAYLSATCGYAWMESRDLQFALAGAEVVSGYLAERARSGRAGVQQIPGQAVEHERIIRIGRMAQA